MHIVNSDRFTKNEYVCLYSLVQLSSLKTETDRIQSEKEKVCVSVRVHYNTKVFLHIMDKSRTFAVLLEDQKQTAELVMCHG